MKIGRGMAVQRHLEALFEGQSIAGLGEVQLLERFVERRDEPAFAALVARHGPMVLGVCRRLLADPLDVEDAFQATFLVLVRRAGSLRDRDRLAPWLFGVARKVATRARLDLARRRARECPGAGEFAKVSGFDDHRSELGMALVEEIDRLPGSLRDPVLLCCVEDLTYDEAASQLRTTAPAIRGRLARARERLRDRLIRRGFAPTTGALGVLLSTEVASAAVPKALLMTTTRASIAGTAPAGVEALAEGVIRTMILTKSKILAAAVVACGVAGSSMSLEAQMGGGAGLLNTRADRLDQVEKKLDRVLQALEGGPDRPPAPPRPAAPPAAPAAPRSPFDLDAPQPPAAPGDEANVPRPEPSTTRGLPGPLRGGQDTRTFARTGGPPASARLDAVERKLERLEARLANLERRLGPERRSGDSIELPEPGQPGSSRSDRPRLDPGRATTSDDALDSSDDPNVDAVKPPRADRPRPNPTPGAATPIPAPGAAAPK